MEASKNYGKKGEGTKETAGTIIQKALKGVGTILITANNTPSNIPLQERDDQLKKVAAIVGNNLTKVSSLQASEGAITDEVDTDLVIPACIGGAGIGKTRLGYECAQYVFRNWKQLAPLQLQNAHTLYFMLDFSYGYSLGDNDENLSAGKILAIRLAHTYFVAQKRRILDFPTFFALCFHRIDLFTIENVFMAIRADLNLTMDVPIFVLLHVDEVQRIFQFERFYKSSSGKGIFKDLIYETCKLFSSGSLMIQPFLSGTSYDKVMASKEPTMYTFEFIDAPLLSLAATFKLIEHYASQFDANPWEWKMQLPFLQLLGDMGGLPRAISYLLEECFGNNYAGGSEFFHKISSLSFYPIFTSVAESVSRKYGLEGFILNHKEAALKILGHAIQGISVTRDTVLGNTSVEELEHKGHIFWHQVGTNYYFCLPFLFVFIYNQHLRIIPDELAQVAFNHDNKVTWQDWESFNALFQVFLNNLLVYKKEKINFTLGDFYHKADGHNDTKNLEIEMRPLEVAPIVHGFPSGNQPVLLKDTGKEIDWTTCRYLLLNNKSAEFGNTVLIRAAEKQTAEKYFGRQVNTIIVSGQQKWDYNGEDFTLEQAVKEHTQALETVKSAGIPDSFGLVTVIFTTQHLPKDKIQSIPKDILIIHQDNFKDYYGPFATRAAFSIAHTLNPNFADIQHLQVLEGVGEDTATAIALKRQKRPFRDLDDLCNRVKRVKKDKLSHELMFFPFTSKSLLFPFEGETKEENMKEL